MDVKEIKNLKAKLEGEIYKSIREFEKETGVTVGKINLLRSYTQTAYSVPYNVVYSVPYDFLSVYVDLTL